MNNALTLPENNEFQMIEIVSRRAAACGLYAGAGNENKIFMILLAARELGVPPMQALNGGIWNIQGKIEISSRLMSSMIRKAGHSIKTIECNAEICILEGTRKDNGDTFKSQFSMKDAVKAGLANRDVWKKYTEDMLYSRALSRLARRLFPDVIGNAYVEGEIRGELVDAEIIQEKEIVKPEIEEENLSKYLEIYDHEEIFLMREFIKAVCEKHKKSISEFLVCYEDREKFITNFEKWKKKQEELKQNEIIDD